MAFLACSKYFTSLLFKFSACKSSCHYLPGIHSIFKKQCSSNWVQPRSSCFRICWKLYQRYKQDWKNNR